MEFEMFMVGYSSIREPLGIYYCTIVIYLPGISNLL